MSGNMFGQAFRVMTFGESHGPYIGVVIDGVQPGVPIDVEWIQRELDRRRPGQSAIVTPRQEKDRVQVISGIFEGKTTGTPICLLIANQDQRSKDYSHIQKIFRPGHAGFTFLKKYGIFDYRGGGRASGRETAARVAAGAVAKQMLERRGIRIFAYTRQVGEIEINRVDLEEIEKNPVRAPDPEAAERMMQAIMDARNAGDSLGGVVEIVVKNCPPGLGEPVFHKLEADLAGALMSIGAVKAFGMGSGFAAARMKGSEHNDPFVRDEATGRIHLATNHAGGVLGGISTGDDLVMHIAVKPPSSIARKQHTVDHEGNPVEFEIGGRHDPCICPRVVPVAEAMVALVLIDHLLMQERLIHSDALQVLRDQIDTIDTQLLLLLAQRKRLVERIARVKQKNRQAIQDPTRETELLQQWKTFGQQLDLPAGFVQELAEVLLRFSRNVQEDVLS
ncbi:MAG: chorismate synthase [Calditrichaeota bacterium]|nr:chorismate synthase [Calditrichota bacterium]